MGEALNLIGQKGVLFIIGVVFFGLAYKNSVQLFQWIEDQTFGTKEYIMKKLEFLHIKMDEKYITYFLLIIAFAVPFLCFAIFALMGNYLLGGILSVTLCLVGWKAPRPFMDYLVAKRIEKYQAQMVDGLNLLTNGIRAGLSVPQSLAMVVDEMPAPISQEFNVILQQNKIGLPLEECFEELARRVPTEDNQMFVSSVNILRETGGNLAETFDTIVGVIRERIRLHQKISAATAQGRMQGMTIFCMPFVMALLYYISDPKSMESVFVNPLGIIMMVGALILNIAGGFIIMKIVNIKV